jgi:ABC-type phosphonate transport system ATPase subunit
VLPKPFLVLSRVAKKYGLSKAEVVAVTEEFNKGQIVGEYGSSKIDLLNAITRVAQNYEQETRVKLETIAGNFLQDEEILEEAVTSTAHRVVLGTEAPSSEYTDG